MADGTQDEGNERRVGLVVSVVVVVVVLLILGFYVERVSAVLSELFGFLGD